MNLHASVEQKIETFSPVFSLKTVALVPESCFPQTSDTSGSEMRHQFRVRVTVPVEAYLALKSSL